MGALTRGEIMLFILTALAGVITGVVVAVPSYWGATREMDVKMVEIAVGILSQEPKENISPARRWAVDVISHYAEVKPSEQVRSALIEHRALRPSYASALDYGNYSAFLSPTDPSSKITIPAPAN